MALYKSKYPELKFYVNGQLHAFSGGSYSTTDEKVIAVLDKLTDVVKVDESKAEAVQVETKEKPKINTKKKSTSAK